MGNTIKNILVWVVGGAMLLAAFNALSDKQEDKQQIEYSQFIQQVNSGEVSNVNIEGSVVSGYLIKGERTDKTAFYTNAPLDDNLVKTLLDNKVRVKVTPEEKPSMLASLFYSLLPVLLLIGAWFYFMRMQSGGGGKGGAFSFGKSRARLLDKDSNKVTFADVAGCDEAKEEVQEIVDYLKAPNRYQSLGGRVPRGILLAGSPGTGKTLLAKAIAGEAGVPFFSISGSDFVEMFVGVGASRVRSLFEDAKKAAPAIIFIDEIDAVGRQRGVGLGGGNDEREQTLNQLLIEMDGFEGNEGIIVIAATNRSDVLDPALLRPGRFDRKVLVGRPDVKGREAILKVHARNKPLAEDVDLKLVAQQTPGFVGADLENVLNEAALVAARRNKSVIDASDIDEAEDRVIAGPSKKDKTVSQKEREMVAYHEAGHTIVGLVLSNARVVHKVTIVPRGRAGGYMIALPKEDQMLLSKEDMKEQLAGLMGGRVAEEIIFNVQTTGASNDFEQATQMARAMVTEYGMSEKLGPVQYEGNHAMFGAQTPQKSISERTAYEIDEEVRALLNEARNKAAEIIQSNRETHKLIAEALLKYETLDSTQIKSLYETGKMPESVEEESRALSYDEVKSKMAEEN